MHGGGESRIDDFWFVDERGDPRAAAESKRVWLFFVGGPERFMGLLRAAWQELLNPSKAG